MSRVGGVGGVLTIWFYVYDVCIVGLGGTFNK